MRAARFGAGAGEAFATEGLHADHGADLVAVDIDVADVGMAGQRLRPGVDAGLDAQSQPIAQGIDLSNHHLRVTRPAHDVQHRAEDFVLQLIYRPDFKHLRRYQTRY